jgi:hypothetical protein
MDQGFKARKVSHWYSKGQKNNKNSKKDWLGYEPLIWFLVFFWGLISHFDSQKIIVFFGTFFGVNSKQTSVNLVHNAPVE